LVEKQYHWVFKDFQKRNGTLSSDWLEIMKNGWQNLIGIIFILYIFGYFFRERVTALLESAVEKLIGLSIIKS
jgi:hypothetical protein